MGPFNRFVMSLRNCLVAGLLLMGLGFACAQSTPEADVPVAQIFAPEKPGPVVLLISGASGQQAYRDYAVQLQRLGYYAVLIDGREVLTRDKDGLGYLKRTIAQAQAAPGVVASKVAVIGFSQGGGGALLHASTLPDQVAAVVAYYPAISWSPSMDWLAIRFRVPVLVLAGEQDRYDACCLIDDMRKLEVAAKKTGANFELVSYPQAGHGFNLQMGTFREVDANDAWNRTRALLAKVLPLPRGVQ